LPETTTPEGSMDLSVETAATTPDQTQDSIQIQDTDDALQTTLPLESVKRKRNSVSPSHDTLDRERPLEKRPKSSHHHVRHWDLEGVFFFGA
jgi:hypothetical protein